MKRLLILLTGLLIVLPLFMKGQGADTLRTRKDSMHVVSFCIARVDTTLNLQMGASELDTNLYGFQKYDPAIKVYPFNASLGNTGQAARNMIFEYAMRCGFNYGLKSFDAYKSDASQNLNYYSLLPFTKLFWTLGSKREQIFQVMHYHHVHNQVFLGLDYRIINAPGRDNYNLNTNNHALSVFTYYTTKNKKYGVFVNYIYNKIKTKENGGITDDTTYINYRKGDMSSGFDVNLKTAETNWRESTVVLKQYVGLSRDNTFNTKDSLKPLNRINLGRIVHTFNFTRQKYKFTDTSPNLSFYPLIPEDTGSIDDSTWFYTYENTLEWTNTEQRNDSSNRLFRYFVKLMHRYTEVRQPDRNYYISDIIPSLGVAVTPYKTLNLGLSGEYVLTNHHKNDVLINASARQQFVFNGRDFGSVALMLSYNKAKPSWFYEHYSSKYFQWDYDFAKQETWHAGLNYSYKRLGIGFDYYNLYNYVYMGADARPRQYTNGVINVLSAYIYKDFVIGKFRIDNKVVYQYTDKKNLVRTPDVSAMQSYLFTTPMFKKALLFQAGIDLLYHTKYYADAYNPATASFYLQNDRKIGNYLNTDVFINLKVKRVRIFFKLSNVLSGLAGYDYFTVLHYPMQDRLFRFGLSWVFYD